MLSDDILNHPIMDREFESQEDFDNIESIMAEAGIFMPEKLTWEPVKSVSMIKYSEKDSKFYSDEIGSYDDIEELYSEIRKAGMDASFDESVFSVEGLKPGVLGGVDKKRPGGWRAMFEQYDPRPLEFHNYLSFLRGAKRFLSNHGDFIAAYDFIQHHPIFWHRIQSDRFEHRWDCESGHKSLWVCPTRNDKGEVVIMLEGGSSVPPKHDHHYHDHLMDVWGSSFENAYIQFALKIHKYHTLDGLDRKSIVLSDEDSLQYLYE